MIAEQFLRALDLLLLRHRALPVCRVLAVGHSRLPNFKECASYRSPQCYASGCQVVTHTHAHVLWIECNSFSQGGGWVSEARAPLLASVAGHGAQGEAEEGDDSDREVEDGFTYFDVPEGKSCIAFFAWIGV